MITLYTFGPGLGLPDPSPFVMKAEVLLKMSGVPFRTDSGGFRKAPKGKLPYIDDDGQKVADSTFIRWHLEKKFQIDFDRGLGAGQKATAWAFEKMLEDHLYWAAVDARWNVDENFARGPARYFEGVPAPVRPLVIAFVRRSVRKSMRGHGMGRHPRGEIEALGLRSIEAMADFLADKPYFMGAEPAGVDGDRVRDAAARRRGRARQSEGLRRAHDRAVQSRAGRDRRHQGRGLDTPTTSC
jgi:glutathione S-transferase